MIGHEDHEITTKNTMLLIRCFVIFVARPVLVYAQRIF
jgi:hypothetical protein